MSGDAPPITTTVRIGRFAGNADRRRAPRLHSTAPLPPDRRTLRMVDISPFGCGLEVAGAEFYQPGQFVQMTLGDDLTIRAIVRWTGKRRIGLEFTRPLASRDVQAALGMQGPSGLTRL